MTVHPLANLPDAGTARLPAARQTLETVSEVIVPPSDARALHATHVGTGDRLWSTLPALRPIDGDDHP